MAIINNYVIDGH